MSFFDLGSLFSMPPHEEREVSHYEQDNLIVDTCSAPDSEHPYETAVSHPDYNEGAWVIVEEYDDAEEAKAGHKKWVATMTADTLPAQLTDVSSSGFPRLADALGIDIRIKPQSQKGAE